MKKGLALLLVLAMLCVTLPTGIAFAAQEGPIAHYEMQENTAVRDSIGGLNGATVGNTAWVKGLSGYAIQLNGGEDYIRIPNAALTQSSDITVSMWVRLDQISTWTSLFVAGSSQQNYVVWAAMGTPFGNKVGMTLAIKQNGGNEYRVSAPDGTVPSVGEWSLITYTQSGTTATLYLNGEQVGRVDNMAGSIKGVLDSSSADSVRIGDNHIFNDPSMVGAVSEILIYDRVLTADTLKAQVAAKAQAAALLELQAAADALTLGDLSDVTEDLSLPTGTENGIQITWASSNTELVTNDGKVTLPTAEQGEQRVTLTATLHSSKTDKTTTKEFELTLTAMTEKKYTVKGAEFVQRYTDYLLCDGYTLLTGKKMAELLGDAYDCEIEWQVAAGKAQIADGRLYKTADAAERQPIELTAVVKMGEASTEVQLKNITLMDEYAAYILSFFGGDDGQQKLHLAYSYDGLNWQKLGGGNSVLNTTMGSGAVRDPYILRKKDGSFAVIATQGWDNNSIYLWDSSDLVSFSGERLRQVSYSGVAGLTGARAWAPEASYDPIKDEYIIYWSDPNANGGKGNIYANTTSDLDTFSKPFVFFDAGYQIIDANIIKWQGSYYMMFKDERGNNADGGGGKHILMAKSDSLEPGSFTQYTDAVTESPVEGPFIFQVLGEEKWYHYYDYFNEHKFGVSVSTDLDSGEWEFLGKSTTMPTDDVRHGGVVPVTQNELDRILSGYSLTETVTAVDTPDALTKPVGTAFDQLGLPETVQATTAAGTHAIPVSWSADGYDASAAGSYTLTGTPDGNVQLSDGVQLRITVTLIADAAVDAVREKLTALPHDEIAALPSPEALANGEKIDLAQFKALYAAIEDAQAAFDALTSAQQDSIAPELVAAYTQDLAILRALKPAVYRPGDVDFSGSVDVSDIIKMKNLIMDQQADADQLLVGDLNHSGKLDVADILAVKNLIMGQ